MNSFASSNWIRLHEWAHLTWLGLYSLDFHLLSRVFYAHYFIKSLFPTKSQKPNKNYKESQLRVKAKG